MYNPRGLPSGSLTGPDKGRKEMGKTGEKERREAGW